MAIPASIAAYLDKHHARYSIVTHPTAYTAQEEAAAAHIPGREWAKAVVCLADDRPLLAVLPATEMVDLTRLKRLLNARTVRLANESEFRDLYSDCEVGAMPPLGPLYSQPVIVDASLTKDEEITFNAGSHRDAIRMPFGEFQRLVQPTVAEFGTKSQAGGHHRTAMADPVCGLDLTRQNAWGRSEFKGETYYFCSQRCKMEFDDNPDIYSGI